MDVSQKPAGQPVVGIVSIYFRQIQIRQQIMVKSEITEERELMQSENFFNGFSRNKIALDLKTSF